MDIFQTCAKKVHAEEKLINLPPHIMVLAYYHCTGKYQKTTERPSTKYRIGKTTERPKWHATWFRLFCHAAYWVCQKIYIYIYIYIYTSRVLMFMTSKAF